MSDLINGINVGDAGDSLGTADSVSFNTSQSALITGNIGAWQGSNYDYYDYFSFVAPVSGVYSASLSGLSDDVDLYLLSSSGQTLDSSESSSNSDEYVTQSLLAGITYYVMLEDYTVDNSDYSLSLSYVVSGSSLTSDKVNGVDIGDAGNYSGDSALISFGSASTVYIEGNVGASVDEADSFEFVAPATETFTFSLTNLSNDLDLILRNDNGDIIESSSSSGTTNEIFNYDLTQGETYSIKVTDYYSGVSSAYDLSVSYSSSGDSKLGTLSDLTQGGSGSGHNFTQTSGIDTLIYQNHSLNQLTISADSATGSAFDFAEDWKIDFSAGDSKQGGSSGSDYFSGERISTQDGTHIALDLDFGEDSAGTALALLFSGFGVIPDDATLGYWIAVSDSVWAGSPFSSESQRAETIGQNIIDYYAPTGISNEDVANLVVSNLLERPLTYYELQVFTALMNEGTYTQASFLAEAASIDELVIAQYWDDVQSGLQYTAYDGKVG